MIPPNVPIPVTLTAANVAPLDPPKIDSDSFSNVTFLFVPPAPSSTMNRSASARVVVAVPPSISSAESGTVPAVKFAPEPVILPVRFPTNPPVAVATPVTVRSAAVFSD